MNSSSDDDYDNAAASLEKYCQFEHPLLDLKDVIRLIISDQCVPIPENCRPSSLNDPSVQIGFAILYSLIWLLGVTGNGLVLAVIIYGATTGRNKIHNHTFAIRSVFVASLSCADLLVAMTSLPVTAVNGFTFEWVFPDFLCYCIGFFQAFSIFQSSFTFTSLAIDRYLLIVYPERTFVTYNGAKFVVIATAVIAAAIASPMAIFMEVVQLEPYCARLCMESWPQAKIIGNFADDNAATVSHRIYSLFVAVLQLGLPTTVTTICYVLISQKLTKQQYTITEGGMLRPEVIRKLSERRHRTNRMMACMVAAFASVWFPLNAMNIMTDFGLFQKIIGRRYIHITYAACHLIAMTSLIWNPLIYAWHNEGIRIVAISFITRWRNHLRTWCRKRRRELQYSARIMDMRTDCDSIPLGTLQ